MQIASFNKKSLLANASPRDHAMQKLVNLECPSAGCHKTLPDRQDGELDRDMIFGISIALAGLHKSIVRRSYIHLVKGAFQLGNLVHIQRWLEEPVEFFLVKRIVPCA